MKLITFEDIVNLQIDPATCVKWVAEALACKDEALLPSKSSLKLPDPELTGMFFNTMPCLLSNGWGGVKVVTRYPKRQPALDSEIMLYNTQTGECVAVMDADWITAMRTGAVAAHTISLLAVKDFTRVGILGLGNTGRAVLACLAALYPEKQLEVGLLRYKDQHESFMQRFANLENVHFHVVDDAHELAKESEVIVSCVTVANSDFCEPSKYQAGCLVVPVHTRGFAECDLVFDKVFCDDTGHVKGFKYFPQFKDKLTEVAQVVAGNHAGRESDEERILAYNIGVALHDMYFASKIYQMMEEKTAENPEFSLVELDMQKSEAKFWV